MTEAQNDTARIKRQVIFFLRFKGRQQPFFLAHTLVHDTLGCWNLNHEFRLHVLCQKMSEFCSAEATTFELPQILAIILVLLSVVLI